MSPKEKKLDATSKMGRILYQMKDLSVRMKPDIRVRVIRVYNTIEANQDDPQLRFRVREDLGKLEREPQLAGLAKRLWKELPNL
jgi:hypothetical protein